MRRQPLQFNLLAAFALLVAALPLRGSEPSATFQEANRLYEQQRYAEAAVVYRNLLDDGQSSVPILFNLGNAEFKAGHPGRAIAAYRMAQRLAPRDPDVRANLQFARDQVRNGQASSDRLVIRMLDWMTLNEWTLAVVVPLWGCFLLLAASCWRRNSEKSLRRLAVICGAVAIVFLAPLLLAAQRQLANPTAVVTVEETVVRRGPFEESQSAYSVRDGVELTVLSRQNGWLQVTDGNQRIGWLQETQATVIQ